MGSGKTTVAEKISQKLSDFSLIDLDTEIELKEKRKISAIFEMDGEAHFRKEESKLLIEKLTKSNQIISTGGGIILKEENRKILKETGTVFWLYASSMMTYERIKDEKHRPLLNTGTSKIDIIKNIDEIMEARFNFYKDTADVIINTDNLTPEECADEIINEFKLLN